MSFSEIAEGLTSTDRPNNYGPPLHDFTKITEMLNALGYRFHAIDGSCRRLEAADFPVIMTCVKLSRETHKHNDDNIIDIHGYMNCLEEIIGGKPIV